MEKNTINGRKPRFGDLEQIEWLKRQARLQEAAERGFVHAEVERDPLGSRVISKQVIIVRFKCPGCLNFHKFSFPLGDVNYEYLTSCGVTLRYEGRKDQLQIKTY